MSLDLALDLGSTTTRLSTRDGEILLEEPTIAAVDEDSGRLLAFGTEALGLGAACAGRVRLREVVRHGQLVDLELTEEAIAAVLARVGASRFNRPRVVVAAHVDVTEIQRRALDRALRRSGARQVHFVDLPVASARGAGLLVDEPLGQMVIDLGGGTTDIAILALGGVVESATVRVGCDDLDEIIRGRLARRGDVVIDRRTADEVRRHLPVLFASGSAESLEVAGRDVRTGAPRAALVGRLLLAAALEELIAPILAAASGCLRAAAPEIANDLLETGIVLGGGGASLFGLVARLTRATGLAVRVADDPEHLAVLGAARGFDLLETAAPARLAAGWR
jgi:rod shape-determining protein MreB and related proteins